MATEISVYVNSLTDAGTLDGTEEVYLASDEKTTVASIRGGINTTIVNIGDWDMDADTVKAVAHGLADYKKIRSVTVIIRDDADSVYYELSATAPVAINYAGVDPTLITLARDNGSLFDSTDFDATSFNRGYITITHID